MIPSKQQEDILSWVRDTNDNLIVEAVAGSGKTTTLEMIIRAIPPEKKVLSLAFSKEIELSMQAKNFPNNVDVRTFHALGLNLLRNSRSRSPRVNARKVENLFKYQVLGYDQKLKWKSQTDRKVFFEFKKPLCDTLSHVKNRGLISEEEIVDELPDILAQYGIDVPALNEFTEDSESEMFFQNTLLQLWELSNCAPQTVDFDDMIYLPLVEDLMFPVWDVVLVDEAQDLNRAQRMFLRKLLGGSIHTEEEHRSALLPWIPTKKRTIVVGDTAQAIYGFRGADLHSMQEFREEFSCTELPLSVCYRCDTSIVEKAQAYVEEISARQGAGAGTVTEIPRDLLTKEVNIGDAILCRFNAPLLDLAFLFWGQDKDVVLTNNALCDTLLKELEWMEERHHYFTDDALEQYINGKIDKFNSQKKKYALANFLRIAECMKVLKKWVDSYDEAEEKLREIFDKRRKDGIILSTIHKAKGLEWDRVFILPERAEVQTQEENNLEYVAVTRARHQLFYVVEEVKQFIQPSMEPGILMKELDRIKKETLDCMSIPAELPALHRKLTDEALEKEFVEGKISMKERIKRKMNRY